MRGPLASVVIGGLITSTLLTLYILPPLPMVQPEGNRHCFFRVQKRLDAVAPSRNCVERLVAYASACRGRLQAGSAQRRTEVRRCTLKRAPPSSPKLEVARKHLHDNELRI